jgi:ribose/xylose/arabinose/galactoside ABC-type transport system permease subunit
VPLALLSLVTGVIQSLGTTWGLLRHHWVVVKLLITVVATGVLLLYLRTFAVMADVAADPAALLDEVRNPSPLVHAVLALVLLVVATVLGVVKPRGLTRIGRQWAARGPIRSRARAAG